MEILGIGWQEFIFVLIIALIVLGPRDMQKAGRTIGRWLNRLVQSDGWKVFQRTSAELRNLPRNLMREANLAEKELRGAIDPRPEPLSPSWRPIDPRSKPAEDTRPGPTGNDSAGQTADQQDE